MQARTRNFNKISIHAPREGCDVPSCLAIAAPFLFQSTHPVRGATGARHLAFDGFLISIHAPREGCDWTGGFRILGIFDFNPRTP